MFIMRSLILLIFVFGIVGCNTVKQLARKREPVVTETRPVSNKPKFNIPEIRRPRIIQANKDNMDVSNKIENIVKQEEPNKNEVDVNKNDIDRNNRFDILLEEAELPNKNQSEVNNKPQSLFDRFFTVLGMGGIVIVLTSGIYFILRNFL